MSLISVTEQWAQFAVAGPSARTLLDGLLDAPVTDEAMPYMACGAVRVAGVAGRLFRISFSGEHAYEIAVPARYGDSLYRLLVAQAETLGGGAYGMEALNVLRLEKGFVTHAEIHGRTTAYDIGMARMISAKKDCVGKTMAARPGLVDPTRERLVGLVPEEIEGRLLPGAHLGAGEGYVTSAGFSPALGHEIALAFLSGGPERLGETVEMIDGLCGVRTRCRVTGPVFFDPEGGRLRG